MEVKAQAEHQWLQKMVGEWTVEMEAAMEPGASPSKSHGTDSVRSLGGVWVICDGAGEMLGGGTGKTIMSLGYDPAKQRFVGTFLGSMMTNLWVYEGQLDANGKVLRLDTVGPSFSGDGTMSKYQDVIEFLSDDHRTLTASLSGEDGKWTTFMTVHYRRKK